MARALLKKGISSPNSGKVVRHATKSKPKVSPKSAGKAKPAGAKTAKKTPPAAQPAIQKESMKMEAEPRKSAFRPDASSTLSSSAPLRQTKTASAAIGLLEKGIELIFRKEYKKARAELKTLLQTYPGELEILVRARSYLQICEREEAAQKKQAISTDQLYTLGVMEHNRGDYERAISYFRQSLGNHPRADYIYYSLAASLALKGDLDGSLENLRKAIELNEDSRVYAKNDADFAPLQARKEFSELVGLPQPQVSELQP